MTDDFVVILFYKFTSITDPAKFKEEQKSLANRLGLTGRIIIATEGINATLEGRSEAILDYQKNLKSDQRFKDLVFKESAGTGRAFSKLMVKVRPEIVTLGAGEFKVEEETATQLEAGELSTWYDEGKDFVVLDLRNDYEIAAGYFNKTVNPGLNNFRDLPAKLPELEKLKNKTVVAVCTGGIRCEKATCLLKRQGFKNLYQLKDGIHTYLDKYPGRDYQGTLFVFDNRMTTPVKNSPNRVTVGHCTFCRQATENYANDDSVRPSRKILCCETCFEVRAESLRSSQAPVRL